MLSMTPKNPRFQIHCPDEEGDSQLIKDWKKCKRQIDPAVYLIGYTAQCGPGGIKFLNTNPMLCTVIPLMVQDFGYTLDELLVIDNNEIRESAILYTKIREEKRKDGANPSA